jgi:hypothetical protein
VKYYGSIVVEFLKSILFELRGSSLRTVKHEQLQQQHQQKQHALDAWSDESGELGGVSMCCCCCLLALFWLLLLRLLLFELFSLLFDEFSRFEYVLIYLINFKISIVIYNMKLKDWRGF